MKVGARLVSLDAAALGVGGSHGMIELFVVVGAGDGFSAGRDFEVFGTGSGVYLGGGEDQAGAVYVELEHSAGQAVEFVGTDGNGNILGIPGYDLAATGGCSCGHFAGVAEDGAGFFRELPGEGLNGIEDHIFCVFQCGFFQLAVAGKILIQNAFVAGSVEADIYARASLVVERIRRLVFGNGLVNGDAVVKCQVIECGLELRNHGFHLWVSEMAMDVDLSFVTDGALVGLSIGAAGDDASGQREEQCQEFHVECFFQSYTGGPLINPAIRLIKVNRGFLHATALIFANDGYEATFV